MANVLRVLAVEEVTKVHVNKFIATVCSQWDDFEHPTLPKSPKLRKVTESIDGMATENIGFLLNYAVSLMEPGECYMEVGTWKGRTLRYAMEGNQDKLFFACDNLSQFIERRKLTNLFSQPEPRRTLYKVLREAAHEYRVTFWEGDFREILPKLKEPIGVYFYDGGHTFRDQYDGLELALPHMAPESLIIVDDANPYVKGVNESEAQEANKRWLLEHRDWKLLFDLPSPVRDRGWHNGVQVLGRFRDSMAGHP